MQIWPPLKTKLMSLFCRQSFEAPVKSATERANKAAARALPVYDSYFEPPSCEIISRLIKRCSFRRQDFFSAKERENSLLVITLITTNALFITTLRMILWTCPIYTRF